jgi:hypothetical protein
MDQCAGGVIKIGGEIRRSDLKEIIESAFEDGAGLDYGPAESHEIRRIIEVAAQNREPVVFFADEGFGGFERLEALCRELGLPYVRHSAECVGAWSEHIEFWEPEMDPSLSYRYACGGDGCPMLNFRQIRRLLSAGMMERELQIMEHIHRFPYILTIVEETGTVFDSGGFYQSAPAPSAAAGQ